LNKYLTTAPLRQASALAISFGKVGKFDFY